MEDTFNPTYFAHTNSVINRVKALYNERVISDSVDWETIMPKINDHFVKKPVKMEATIELELSEYANEPLQTLLSKLCFYGADNTTIKEIKTTGGHIYVMVEYTRDETIAEVVSRVLEKALEVAIDYNKTEKFRDLKNYLDNNRMNIEQFKQFIIEYENGNID